MCGFIVRGLSLLSLNDEEALIAERSDLQRCSLIHDRKKTFSF